ncbi:MAG TPA: nucleotidyltransferase family protein [Anaerolineales bacterium]|jgi:molybdenum cofactor cytidylyltransferase
MISAIILAAGESKRMGRQKMLLPWGTDSVLGHVISVFQAAGIDDILVVTGSAHERVVSHLAGRANVRTVFNANYAEGEMLSSIQCGLAASGPGTSAALIGLGDQPQVQKTTVERVCTAFRDRECVLVVPSYHMRRGHPWLIARSLWSRLADLGPPQTARDFLNSNASEIEYVNIDSPSLIEDLDTPGDYRRFNPTGP